MSTGTDGIQGQRIRKSKGHESIRREAIQDKRLSFKATGILTYLLSLPDNWRTDADRLSKEKNKGGKAKEGREAIQAGLRELEDAGYLVRHKYQGQGGRWQWIWQYADDPADLADLDVSAGNTGNGLSGDGTTGDGSPVDIEVLGVEVKTSTSTIADATADDDQPPLVEAGVEPVADKPQRPEVEQLCSRLADLVEGNGARRPVITKAWRDAARLLLDRDKAPLNQVTYVLDWCQRDEFWRVNVLSMPTFRKQYDRLAMKARQEAERRRNGQVNGRDVQDMRAAVAMRRAAMNVDGDF